MQQRLCLMEKHLYGMMVVLGQLAPVLPNARLVQPRPLSPRVWLSPRRFIAERLIWQTISYTIARRCFGPGCLFTAYFFCSIALATCILEH